MNRKIAKKFIFDCLDSFKIKILTNGFINIFFTRGMEVLFLPYILKIIGDKYQNNTLTLPFMLILSFIYTMGFASRHLIAAYFWKQLWYNTYTKFDDKLRQNIFNFIIKHSIDYFDNKQAGVLTSKIKNIISSFNNVFEIVFSLLRAFLMMTISIFIYFKIDNVLFSFLLVWSVIFLIYNYYSSRVIARYTKKSFDEQNKMSGLITDNFINISNIKATAKQYFEGGNVKKQGLNILRANGVLLTYDIIFGIIIFIFMVVLQCFMLMYSVRLFAVGKITMGTMIFTGQNIILLSLMLKRGYKDTRDFIEEYSRLCDGLNDIIQEYDIVDKSTANELKLISGKIVFKDVKFKY